MLNSPTKPITRENIDAYLDNSKLVVQMRSGRWHRIRRNGQTKRWKRDPMRIAVPFKHGLYGYGKITESDFYEGCLDPSNIRHVDDVPENIRT